MKRSFMNSKRFAVVAVVLCALLLIGCGGSYYKVRDTASGKVYYTTQIDRSSSGSVRFMDEAGGGKVTLQNSEITEINKEEFRSNTPKK